MASMTETRSKSFTGEPDCQLEMFLDGYLLPWAEDMRQTFNVWYEFGRPLDVAPPVTSDLGQLAWVLEESARQIHRLKCGNHPAP